jgi:glutamine synthetase
VPTSAIENKRLELRVPSAAVAHEKVIFWLLFAVVRAMYKKTASFPIIYGDAYDAQYAQESLPISLKEAKEYDNFKKVYEDTMKYFI